MFKLIVEKVSSVWNLLSWDEKEVAKAILFQIPCYWLILDGYKYIFPPP